MEDRVQDNFTNRSEVSLESLKHPQQESGEKMSTDKESLVRSILDDPEALAELRQKLNEVEKAENPSKWKKRLLDVVGFFQCLVCGSTPRAKAILAFVWTRLLYVFSMQLEISKEKRTKLDEVQKNLKEVNEAHEKVVENVGEIEDKIRKTRENDYRTSCTESKDLGIQLIIAERDLGNCEDGLSAVQRDVERLKAATRWLKFVQIIGFIFATALAAGVLYYFFNPANFVIREIILNGRLITVEELTTPSFMTRAGCLVVIGLLLKWMIGSLYISWKLLPKCEKALEDDLRKAKSLHEKLKRAVKKELPEMKKHLVVSECDVSRYASLQKLDSD